MAKRSKSKGKSRTASFDGVGKSFAKDQEYLVEVKETEVEESDNGLYISMKLEGTGEFKGSIMYHNASLSETALWKTRDVFEAFLGDIPEGDFDVDEWAEKFVGTFAMCDTYADTYNDKTRIKPQNFWASEDHQEGDDGDEGEELDLDEMDDADIKKLGKEMKIKSKRASTIRKELEDADEDDLMAALVKLGLVEEDEDDGDDDDDDDGDDEGGVDLDDMSDEDILAIGKAAGVKGKKASTVKKKLEALDEDDLAEAIEEAGVGEGSTGGSVTADDIGAMNQAELEAFVEEHELDVDLDDIKTLRKKRVAVIDAAEEEELLEDD